MEAERILVNGDRAVVTIPDASALPSAVATGVLFADGSELEVNAGGEAALAFFLDTTETAFTSTLTLRGGAALRMGSRGGDAGAGRCFGIAVGKSHLFGWATPSTSVETLAGWLSSVDAQALGSGIQVRPGGHVSWSPYRTFSVAQQVDLADGSGYLLDLRRIRADRPPRKEGGGLRVRGGLLTRSAPSEEQPHVVLESAAFVSYGIPIGAASLDRIATSMASATTVLR